MKRLAAVAALLAAGSVLAQAPCPQPGELTAQMLLGTWQADLPGEWDTATLVLAQHPEYAGSFRGTLQRGGRRLEVAGDYDEDDGAFTLEESADGRHIAAAWAGEIVEGSCGREIRGTWTRDGEAGGGPFVLRRR